MCVFIIIHGTSQQSYKYFENNITKCNVVCIYTYFCGKIENVAPDTFKQHLPTVLKYHVKQ